MTSQHIAKWRLEHYVHQHQEHAADLHVAARWLLDEFGDCEHAIALACSHQRDAELYARHARKHLDRLLGIAP